MAGVVYILADAPGRLALSASRLGRVGIPALQMSNIRYSRSRPVCIPSTIAVLAIGLMGGCDSTMPSARLRSEVNLPIPSSAVDLPKADRLSDTDRGESRNLSARSLIPLAFDLQPDIKSSFQRFKSEEARYDFFVVSRDSLTPQLSVSNRFNEFRANESVARDRDHVVELSVEKLFFDTTELNLAVGYETGVFDEDIGNNPFVSADLRYPLWASREKLARTSVQIFRRNELNDALLDYIQVVRRRLENAMFRFYEVASLARTVDNQQEWVDDLKALVTVLDGMAGGKIESDRERVRAELARASAELRNQGGRYKIQLARLKSSCGLPFHTQVKLMDAPFNPFEGFSHEELMRLSIETDPEIATLRNEVRNAEVQLDLARRGQWDIALLANGRSSLEGRGEDDGISDWSLSVGFEVSLVDSRVTSSLIRQAQTRIARFLHAIASRENSIFTDTLEPIVRLETIGASRKELIANLPRFAMNYRMGIDDYQAGKLNIDDLLTRRETLFEQEQEISFNTFLLGANVAELCAATGKFFELLSEDRPD